MILLIYNKRICKEILLPNSHDVDYKIELKASLYQLREDICLELENSARGWELFETADYSLRCNHEDCKSRLLQDEDVLRITTKSNESLLIIVAAMDTALQVMHKYQVRMGTEIRIGSHSDNTISYSFSIRDEGEVVSGIHAILQYRQDGWFISDTGRNGIFRNNIRLRGNNTLGFGEKIDIFGLHLIFMGDILLVGSNRGHLTIKEENLIPVRQEEDWDKKIVEDSEVEESWFNRAPRTLPSIYQDPVEIEAPPAPKRQRDKPMLLVIGPSFTMAIPMLLGCLISIYGSRNGSGGFMFTGLIMAGGSAIFGALWATLNLRYTKQTEKEDEELRFNAYSNYLIGISNKLSEQYRRNTEAMNEIYPSARQMLSYGKGTPQLWNRNMTHADFLFHRLGLGDQPFQVEISVPKEKFTLINDSLQNEPGRIRDSFKTLHQVPNGIDFKAHRLIGVIGGKNKAGAITTMHTLTADIAASNCYTDVKLVYIYDRNRDQDFLEDWECNRWFPHVWSEDKSTRYMASDELERRDIFFELSNILRTRAERVSSSSGSSKNITPKPYYILFISDPRLLEGELISKYVYEALPEYGITTLLMVSSADQLPNACETVIENDEYYKGFYNLMEMDMQKQHAFIPDEVSRIQLEDFGKRLANIHVREMETTSEIPSSLTFFEMYGVNTLEEFQVMNRWRKNRNYNSMKALVGHKAGGADCYLDIHEKFHGPHGLVAGTTGSGKSETLQTYILSLALNFSPEDVSFFIIDFKGGGMANLFNGLPHLAGQISNLSGNQVSRAMISIESENKRRQKIFNEYNVNNINLYTTLYKNQEAKTAVPHLFIIIDEFAELKREEPEFMAKLISVAQVGRSLGVHLILATQKPSGTVDDNIWSNSKFRLCLRVQDRQDSMDMLHKPDAAFLTQAGRCYLQVGQDEIYELFQSGYSGAVYSENVARSSSSASMITRTGKIALVGRRGDEEEKPDKKKERSVVKKTQLDAVIEYLAMVARENGYSQSPQLWMPLLGNNIAVEELKGGLGAHFRDGVWPRLPQKFTEEWGIRVPIGKYDDPESQSQDPLVLDFTTGGHMAVLGVVGSGKSTFLQTLVYGLINRYSPDEVQLYLLDFSSHMLSCFDAAPHVGGIVQEDQEDRIRKFFHMMMGIMDRRRQIFSGTNYGQYVLSKGMAYPSLFVVIDNFASFREKTESKYDTEILRILREGPGYGIYLVTSSTGFGMNDIPVRFGDNIRTIISLEQNDKFKYMDALRKTHLQILPETNVKGRGLCLVDERILEFQTAVAVKASDTDRNNAIEKLSEEMERAWMGRQPERIPEIPENPTLTLLRKDARYGQAFETGSFLPFAYRMQDASIYSVDLEHNYCFIITGKARSGKTNVLKLLMSAAHYQVADLVVIEKETSFRELAKAAGDYGAREITDSASLYNYMSELLPEFVRRNKKKQRLLASGMDESQIYQAMAEEKPICIFIANMPDFIQMVYKPEKGVGDTHGFVENIMEKGALHNIFFFGCLRTEDAPLMAGYRAYNLYVGKKKGVHLGGNLQAQKIFSFSNIPFNLQSKPMKKGFGYVSDDAEEGNAVEIVIPLAR